MQRRAAERPRSHETVSKPQSDRSTEAERRCLRCRQTFRSSHVGNRLCKTCLHTIERSGLPA